MRILTVLLFVSFSLHAADYNTFFGGGNEVPISETGHWLNGQLNGASWSNCGVTNGLAYGSQLSENPSGNPFNDSTTCLTGQWGPNQSVSGVVSINRSGSLNSQYIEQELRLNTSITLSNCTGYEIDFSANIPPLRSWYCLIVKWNGPFQNFTVLASTNTSNQNNLFNLHTGDAISAINSNGTISAYINGTNVLSVTDTTYTNGSPGFGFDMAVQSGTHAQHNTEYGYTEITASDSGQIGKQWYVDNSLASSLNNGNDWTNAFTNFTSIPFNKFSNPHVSPGDVIWVSGGTNGNEQVYYASLNDAGSSTADGVAGSNIVVNPGRDPAHDGLVKIVGGGNLGRDYWGIDGAKWFWHPASVLDCFYNVTTNCGIWFYQTNKPGNSVTMFGQGSFVRSCHISNVNGDDDNGVQFADSGPSRPVGNGSAIQYNWIENVNGYGVRCEINNVVNNTYSQISIDHNLIEKCNDNFTQVSGWGDINYNVMRFHQDPDMGHPDVFQEMEQFSRAIGNFVINHKGSFFYIEANNPLTHDIVVANNVVLSDTNYFGNYYTNSLGSVITNNPGTTFDCTGHDGGVSTPCVIANVYEVNNTALIRQNNAAAGQPSAFIWSSLGRSSASITNWWFENNCVAGLPPNNTQPYLQFFTNDVTAPGVAGGPTGFRYLPSDMHVDFNSISGGTAPGGNGICYGDGGSQNLTNYYPSAAAFGIAYPQYSHNNNTAPVFAATPDNRPYTNIFTSDLRPAPGDTALSNKGTNLAALLATVAPECTNDIIGVPRGVNWAIGAFQPIASPNVFYVGLTGNDSSTTPTNISTPWRTFGKAYATLTSGQQAIFGPGSYGERDITTSVDGTANNRITFSALPENDWLFPVQTYNMRVKHRFITLDGFTLVKPAGINGAHIRVEPPNGTINASDVIITNCTLRDSVFLVTHTANFGPNWIHIQNATEGVNFNNAGFVPGMQVYFGSDTAYFYTNCGATPIVASNSADGLTMYFNQTLAGDPGSNYFAAIVAGGNGPTSWNAVYVPVGSGGFPAASNVTIVNCTFSNLFGVCINLSNCQGSNHVNDCWATHMHGGYWMNNNASSLEIGRDTVFYSKNLEHWAADELINPNFHPSGGQFFDWQNNLSTGGLINQSNVWMHDCWYQEADNELWETDWATNCTPFLIQRCVFIGIPQHGSVNGDGANFDHCTFVRCGYSQKEAECFAIGNAPPHPLNGGVIFSNVFVNNGGHFNTSQEVPWGIPAGFYTNFIASNNFSVFPETMGWSNTPANTWTNNGGTTLTGVLTNAVDPIFLSYINPLGPDGLPFTDDDGLRPLPNSLIATLGLGALKPVLTIAPVAHFTLVLPSPGWKDPTGTNYDPVWMSLRPDQRVDDIRPWATPEALGSNSVTATLDARNSIDGQGLSNAAITNYTWLITPANFTLITNNPVMSYTFMQPGTNQVTLTVTANGASSTFSNQFRILAPTSDPFISVQPQNQSVIVGQTATFSVTANGASTISYQWQLSLDNGSTWNNIGGATASTLSVVNCQLSDSGKQYRVNVSDTAGNINSSAATLTVSPPPPVPSKLSIRIGNGKITLGPNTTMTIGQ